MAKDQIKYPFMEGCKNLPKDKDEEVKQVKSWMETQPHLPEISGRFTKTGVQLPVNSNPIIMKKQTNFSKVWK